MTNKNVLVLNTKNYGKPTRDNFQKSEQSGVIYLKCLKNQQEIPFRFKNKKELNKVIRLNRQSNNEYKLKMVS